MKTAAVLIAVAVLVIVLVVAGAALRLHTSTEEDPDAPAAPSGPTKEPLYGRGLRSGDFTYPYGVASRSYTYYLDPPTGLPDYAHYETSRGLTGGRPPVIDHYYWPALAAPPGPN